MGQPESQSLMDGQVVGKFSCSPLQPIPTFGHKIAAAHYDSATGILGLSLSSADLIQAMKGSPDGLVLFCVHGTP